MNIFDEHIIASDKKLLTVTTSRAGTDVLQVGCGLEDCSLATWVGRCLALRWSACDIVDSFTRCIRSWGLLWRLTKRLLSRRWVWHIRLRFWIILHMSCIFWVIWSWIALCATIDAINDFTCGTALQVVLLAFLWFSCRVVSLWLVWAPDYPIVMCCTIRLSYRLIVIIAEHSSVFLGGATYGLGSLLGNYRVQGQWVRSWLPVLLTRRARPTDTLGLVHTVSFNAARRDTAAEVTLGNTNANIHSLL